MLRCNICFKDFTSRRNLLRHVKSVHNTEALYKCEHCSYSTSRKDYFTQHKQVHDSVFKCEICHKKFNWSNNLTRHLKDAHDNVNEYKCVICDKSFTRNAYLQRHEQIHKTKRKGSVSDDTHSKKPRFDEEEKNGQAADDRQVEVIPDMECTSTTDDSHCSDANSEQHLMELFEEDDTNLDNVLSYIDPALREEYSNNWPAIKMHFYEPKKSKDKINHAFYTIRWMSQTDAFDFTPFMKNIFDRQSKRFKINYSHSFILRNKETEEYKFYHASRHVGRVLDSPSTINNYQNFLEFVERINNKDIWQFALNYRPDSKWTVAAITSTTFFVDRMTDFPIGQFSTPLPKTQGIYTLQKNWNTGKPYNDNLCFFRCLALSRGYVLKGLEKPAKKLAKQWERGVVTLADIPQLEEMFDTNIDVFQYESNETKDLYLVPVIRSQYRYESTMYLLLHENHFCYIYDIDQATRSYGCSKCNKLFSHLGDLNKHEKICSGTKTKSVYPGGVYEPPRTSLEVLTDEGIDVEQILRDNDVDVETKFVYPFRATYDFEAYLKPMERASDKTTFIAEHVPLSVSVCSNVPGYQEPYCFISEGDSQKLVNEMGDYLEEISSHAYALLLEQFKPVFDEIEDKSDDIERHKTILNKYLKQMPVVGFNTSKYDINMTKPFMIQRFILEDLKNSHVIKKGNEFISISTEFLIFLDITKFIAPGYSYSKYLSAFKIKETKGHFCYEYMTGLEKLDETELPPKEAFYSRLKDQHISGEDYNTCQQVWKENDMKTLRDFLIWYNNKDTKPFIEALEVQSKVFQDSFKMDMLKDAKTIPGLTLKYVFDNKPADVFFSLIGEKHKDLHMLMQSQIVGGPSLIFTRYHEKDVTCIRGGKLAKRLLGYDSNALYLAAFMDNLPTEYPIRRRKENGFRCEKVDRFGQLSREWLEWTAFTNGTHIRHQFNGRERSFKVGTRRIPVDGWDGKKAFQFHGCAFHGHRCHITKNQTHHPYKKDKTLDECREDTERIKHDLENIAGVSVVEIWECEWLALKANNPEISTFLSDKSIGFKSVLTGRVTQAAILKKVKSGEFFGMVQCDIHVPDNLKAQFAEMPPIFKNTEVSINDIGSHMQEYCKRNKLMRQPRRTLISSYLAQGILLTTPLLKWYLEHGLVVTDIQQLVEYKPNACFKRFGLTVTKFRRAGDKDADSSILADTWKLLGNSAYGKTLEDLGRHTNIKYVEDSSKLVKDPLFLGQSPISDEIMEVEMGKKRVKWNLPIQIGYFVYQYAKLRMLEFYHDCIREFFDEVDYELGEMDTDSLYMMISASCLDDIVKEEKKREFYETFHTWFPSPACDAHRKDFVDTKCLKLRWDTCSRPCCQERFVADKRTPGIFKVEYEGDGLVALTSKTYICFRNNTETEGPSEVNVKMACKGLNKNLNKLTKKHYLDVLRTQINGGGTNRGFKTDNNNKVITYDKDRSSLSYLYFKRIVDDNGITTKPLEI